MPPKARLTRERIVAAGLVLVDRGGLEGLTMRALARELGVDPMAVYRHVRDKDDLLGLMCDSVLAQLDAVDPDGPWEPQARRLAEQLRDRLLARPALLPALACGPVTQASLDTGRDLLALLVRAGMPDALAVGTLNAVLAYVLGYAELHAAGPLAVPPQTRTAPGDPALALLTEPADFDLGLDLLLDGVRARLP